MISRNINMRAATEAEMTELEERLEQNIKKTEELYKAIIIQGVAIMALSVAVITQALISLI